MNASKWQAIVFDLDDTLYPERNYVLSGLRAVADWAEAHLNIPSATAYADLKYLFDQGVRGATFNRWLSANSIANYGLVLQLVQVYREHEPSLTPFAQVMELLTLLRKDYRLGLGSDGFLSVQQRKLAALGLTECFDAIVFSNEWGRAAWKPSTIPFEIVSQRLGVRSSHSLYVADNPLKDFFGARQVGMLTVQVRRPDGEYIAQIPPTPEHAPHVTMSLDELTSILSEVQPLS